MRTSRDYYLRTAFILLGAHNCAATIRGQCLIEEIQYSINSHPSSASIFVSPAQKVLQ